MLLNHSFLFPLMAGIICCNGSFAADALPKWTNSTITKVKPERRIEFEGYVKQMMAAYKKSGTLWFSTFETFAGDTTEYTIVVPVMSFSDLDGIPAVAKALGNNGWATLSRKMARCYTAQNSQYATPQTELEIQHSDMPGGTYWVETRMRVTPGKVGEYLNWLKNDYRPALEKAGVAGFRVLQPIFGVAAGEIVTMRMLDNLTEIDKGAVLSRVLTDDQARAITIKSATLVSSSQTRIVRLRRDLSYSSGTPY